MRAHIPGIRQARFVVLLVTALLVAGCAGGGQDPFLALDATAASAHVSLGEAVQAADGVEQGERWSAAAEARDRFDESAAQVRGIDSDLDAAALLYSRSAGYLLNLLRQDRASQAEAVLRQELDPALRALEIELGGHLEPASSGAMPSLPAGWSIARIAGVLLAVGAAITGARALSARRAVRRDAASSRPPRHATATPARVVPDRRPVTATRATGASRATEASRATRGGVRSSDLRGIVDASLAPVVKAGWEIEIDVPDVTVVVDPLRLRRVIGNLLLSVASHGTERVAIFAEEEHGRVAVWIGDGGPSSGSPGAEHRLPAEAEHQLAVTRRLLAGMDAEADWVRVDGASLYVLQLAVGGPVEEFGSPAADLQIAEAV